MAMPDHVYLAKMTFSRKSMITADRVDWDFHFRHTGSDPDETDFTNLADHLEDFINVPGAGGTNAVGEWLGNSLKSTGTPIDINFYLLPSLPGDLGAPVSTRQRAIGTSTTDGCPDEVAICLSYQAGTAGIPEFSGATRPRARRRNRTYIGPVAKTTIDYDGTTKEPFVLLIAREDIVEAARDHLFAGPAADGWSWEAVSRTEWTSRAVFDCWVDNAFDIQRRRGNEATARTFITL